MTEPTVVDWLTLAAAGVAVLMSGASVWASLHLGRATRQHADRSWQREQRRQAIESFVTAFMEMLSFLTSDVPKAATEGNVTEEVRAEFRSRQQRVQSAYTALTLWASQASLALAEPAVRWMDTGIEAFPSVGGPFESDGPAEIFVRSVQTGQSLFAPALSALRVELGNDPIDLHAELTVNTYGK